jgi:malate permease and related proteins
MAVLIACGAIWRILQPAGLTAEQTRQVLTTVVYYLMLPAMVLNVLAHAEIGQQSLQFTILGVSSVFFAMAVIWGCGKIFRFRDAQLGAVILAASFPNVTYLGLPVLEQTFGLWARSVAIQLDLFAAGPIVFTIGIMIARYYGHNEDDEHKPVLAFLNAPPFWAAAAAVLVNVYTVPFPNWFDGVLQRLSDGVVPLMLFSLGLALSWKALAWRNVPYVLPVIIVKMCLMPWFALWLADRLVFSGEEKMAAILEMAMPSMVLGIVFCDRYRLDSEMYAMAVTVTTVLSLVTLPFWYDLMQ